jgi:hypothetical protein
LKIEDFLTTVEKLFEADFDKKICGMQKLGRVSNQGSANCICLDPVKSGFLTILRRAAYTSL